MSGYIGATPVPQSIQTKQTFTATASQTTFGTTGYSDGTLVDVHLNGVLLVGGGVDYTATNGSDIVLTTGASAGDTLEFSTFSALQLSDQVFNNSITLQNPTEEDTDGGRESTLIFKGEQSGGEKTTLAEIEASHDGTADDQKGDLIFRTNDGSDGSAPTEAARIDSAQNLLVGATAPTPGNGNTDTGHLLKSDGRLFSSSASNSQFNRNSDGDILTFRQSGNLVGSIGVTSSRMFTGTGDTGLFFNDQVDSIDPWNTSTNAARDGAIDLGDGSRRFKDLYLSGDVFVNKTAKTATGSGIILDGDGFAYFVRNSGVQILLGNDDTGGTSQEAIRFVRNSSDVGSIDTTSTATSYNTSSDYRLKTDVQPMTGATDRLKQLNPVNFEWIADGTRVDGFLAHEAQTVVPEAVTGTHNGMQDEEYQVSAATGDIYTPAVDAVVDEEGNEVSAAIDEVIHSSNVEQPETLEEGQQWRETTAAVMGTRSVPDYQGIDQSKLVPLLTAALQEAIAKIETLETRVAALEG